MSESTVIVVPTTEPWVTTAVALRPSDPEPQYLAVAEAVKSSKAFQAGITAMLAEPKKLAHQAHKSITELEAKLLAPAKADEERWKGEMRAWDNARESERKAEEARLQEVARKAEEARRLEEAAAMEREANEKKAAAAALAADGDEIEAAIAAAEAEELQAEAEASINRPIEAPVVIVQKATPKVTGISYNKPWASPDVEVFDLDALANYAMSNRMHRHLIKYEANLSALKALAKSLKATMQIPGVRVGPGGGMSVGRK